MEIQEKQENLSLGILGALLGGILGGAAIVLIGQLGSDFRQHDRRWRIQQQNKLQSHPLSHYSIP